MRSHTNVVTVFDELERQPAFFRPASSSSLDGAGGPTGTADAAGANGGGAAAQLNGALGQQKRPPKTEKLVGMIRVVLAALATCAVLYSIVGVSCRTAWLALAWLGLAWNLGASLGLRAFPPACPDVKLGCLPSPLPTYACSWEAISRSQLAPSRTSC